jgi:hypothetical protein
MTTNPAVEALNLCRRLPFEGGAIPVLSDVSLRVPPGDDRQLVEVPTGDVADVAFELGDQHSACLDMPHRCQDCASGFRQCCAAGQGRVKRKGEHGAIHCAAKQHRRAPIPPIDDQGAGFVQCEISLAVGQQPIIKVPQEQASSGNG